MDFFEKAAWEVDKENSTLDGELNECVIEWAKRSRTATINVPCHSKYASKIRVLAQKYPEDVQIVYEREGGTFIAHIPVKAIKISIRDNYMSDEQKEEAAERLRAAREKRGLIKENANEQ